MEVVFERYSERARRLIVMALWSARKRGGSHIEPEDLLHALIREDRGEFAAIGSEVFPGALPPEALSALDSRPFFSDSVARTLLRELREDPAPLTREAPAEKRDPVPRGDMPVSRSLSEVLTSVAKAHKDDTKIIEPLDLLTGIVENRDTPLAQVLRKCGITRQKVANALTDSAA